MFESIINQISQQLSKSSDSSLAIDQAHILIKDQRTKVTDTSKYPYNTLGILKVQFQKQSKIGTACIINSRLIITSAHNFCLKNSKQKPLKIKFQPEYQNQLQQRSQINIVQYQILPKYFNTENVNFQKYDIALAKLQQNYIIPKQLKVNIDFYYSYWDSEVNIINISGYKLNSNNDIYQLWNSQQYSKLKKTSIYFSYDNFLHYENTTDFGFSGAPVFIKRQQFNEVTYAMVGIHKAGLSKSNAAVLLGQHKQAINLLIQKLNLPSNLIPQFYQPSYKRLTQLLENSQIQNQKLLKQLEVGKKLKIQNKKLLEQLKAVKNSQIQNKKLLEELKVAQQKNISDLDRLKTKEYKIKTLAFSNKKLIQQMNQKQITYNLEIEKLRNQLQQFQEKYNLLSQSLQGAKQLNKKIMELNKKNDLQTKINNQQKTNKPKTFNQTELMVQIEKKQTVISLEQFQQEEVSQGYFSLQNHKSYEEKNLPIQINTDVQQQTKVLTNSKSQQQFQHFNPFFKHPNNNPLTTPRGINHNVSTDNKNSSQNMGGNEYKNKGIQVNSSQQPDGKRRRFSRSSSYQNVLYVRSKSKKLNVNGLSNKLLTNRKNGYQFVKDVIFYDKNQINWRYQTDYKSNITIDLHQLPFVMKQFVDCQWENLQKLNLEQCQIDDSKFAQFLYNGNLFPSLKILNLRKNLIRQFKYTDFRRFKSLKEINFGKNCLTKDSKQQLQIFCKKHPDIKVIY